MKTLLLSLAGTILAGASASNRTVASAPGPAFSIGQPVTIKLTTNDSATLGLPTDTTSST